MLRWTVELEGGPKRVNHAAVAISDRIYSFGGYCTGENYETTTPMDVHLLDTVSLRWRLILLEEPDNLTSIPYQRYGHTAVAYNENAYIWGGRNDKDGACNILYGFNSNTHVWFRPDVCGSIPNARDGHSACVINHKMYVFGGYEEETDRFSNEIYALDFSTFSWSLIVPSNGEPARWRDFHTATGIGHLMYIFGGRSDHGGNVYTNNEIYCNKLQIFDTLNRTWIEPETTGVLPIGRRSHSAFVYRGYLYIFGGYNGKFDYHFRDVLRFDPVHLHWSMVKLKGKGPCARRRQCCCVIGNKVFLFGGTSPSVKPAIPNQNNDSDLTDHSDLHVLDFAPTLKTLCQIAVVDNKIKTDCLPQVLQWEIAAMTTNNTISSARPSNTNG
ncbi:kelch domain-containing protein 3-like [Mytilus trossulus]|uniref:kelch domain-containing protein 3-like n=1 Tax=Mytilus trossulus TaxID=6551 RepID=UPI0030070C1D